MSDDSANYLLTDFDVKNILLNASPVMFVDKATEKVSWANPKTHSLFGCSIVDGLIGEHYTFGIPSRFHAAHKGYWEWFWKDPKAMMMSKNPLTCRRLDESEFGSFIIIIPVNAVTGLCAKVGFIPESVIRPTSLK